MTSKILADVVAPLDALLLKGDPDPTTRAITTMALVLEHPPEFGRLSDAFDRASRAVPRMRQRVITSPWTLGHSEWVLDEDFDLVYHLRRVGAPGDRTLEAVLAMASEAATAPFDPARPLWDAVLVDGLDDSRAVLLLRAHHAIADGVRAIQMMANLLDLEEDPSRGVLPPLEERVGGFRRTFHRLARSTSQAAMLNQQRAGALARAMFDTALKPVGSMTSAATYARSAIRTYGSGGAEPSELFVSRSRTRSYATLELPLDAMRAAAKANSATVNDVFLTGLLGGVRKYHEALGRPVQDVPISFPIDVSGDDAPTTGNHFSAAVIPGPSSVADPNERLRQVHALVASRRAEPGVNAAVRLAPALHQIPAWLAAAGMAAYSRRVDLQASNVVGPDCATYLAGVKIDRFHAFGPLPGIPLMVVLVSYEGLCTLGFTIDPAAVVDPELFLESTRKAFDEVLGS